MEIVSGITEFFHVFRETDGRTVDERKGGQNDFNKHSAGMLISLEVEYTMAFNAA